jgi:hypothetical protein
MRIEIDLRGKAHTYTAEQRLEFHVRYGQAKSAFAAAAEAYERAERDYRRAATLLTQVILGLLDSDSAQAASCRDLDDDIPF